MLTASLQECAGSYGSQLQEVILLGDVFDSYMEFPNAPDPDCVLLEPFLKSLISRQISISYFVGNHDPWHLDHFEKMFHVAVHESPQIRRLHDRRVYLSHGDEEDVFGHWGRITRHFMRTPIYYRLYRTVMPRSFGQILPKLISTRHAVEDVKTETVDALTDGARRRLESDDIDVVIFGHSHAQMSLVLPHGQYINAGSWYRDCSYVEIGQDNILPRRWNATSSHR